jgi:quercetin dioxygenase-like cupin family protein
MDAGVGFAAHAGNEHDRYDLEFGPNSSSGWHSHPGKALVTVQPGTFTAYHAKECEPRVYEAGDAFVERPGL